MNGQTVVVTGGAGFVGSHVVSALLKRGAHVVVVDSFVTGSVDNLAHLRSDLDASRLTVLDADIVDHHFISQVVNVCTRLPLPPVSWIFNLACPASPAHYQRLPMFTLRTCSTGVFNVIDLAHALHAGILHASTSEVYGDPAVSPQPESYVGAVSCTGPRSCYDEGKRFAESALLNAFNTHRIPRLRLPRLFNTYGPRMSPADGRVIPQFINQAIANIPLTIYGDGCQTRSAAYVDDTVHNLLALINVPDHHPQLPHLPVNVGNPFSEMSVLNIAHSVIHCTRSQSIITHLPASKDDPRQRCPDVSRLISLVGQSHATSFSTGLQLTVDFVRLQ